MPVRAAGRGGASRSALIEPVTDADSGNGTRGGGGGLDHAELGIVVAAADSALFMRPSL